MTSPVSSSFYQRTFQKNFNKNTVIESTGPEGKIRGTAQQLMDKYLSLGKEALREKDIALAQNFFQHADHYGRLFYKIQKNSVDHRRPQVGSQNGSFLSQNTYNTPQERKTHRHEPNINGPQGNTYQNLNLDDQNSHGQSSNNHQNPQRFQRQQNPYYQGQKYQQQGAGYNNNQGHSPNYQGQKPYNHQQRPKYYKRPITEELQNQSYGSNTNPEQKIEEYKMDLPSSPLDSTMVSITKNSIIHENIQSLTSLPALDESTISLISNSANNNHADNDNNVKTPRRRRILKKDSLSQEKILEKNKEDNNCII